MWILKEKVFADAAYRYVICRVHNIKINHDHGCIHTTYQSIHFTVHVCDCVQVYNEEEESIELAIECMRKVT